MKKKDFAICRPEDCKTYRELKDLVRSECQKRGAWLDVNCQTLSVLYEGKNPLFASWLKRAHSKMIEIQKSDPFWQHR